MKRPPMRWFTGNRIIMEENMKRYRHPTEIPRSREIVGLEWIGERVPVAEFGVRGDTYPMTWGADDEIYMGTGDPN